MRLRAKREKSFIANITTRILGNEEEKFLTNINNIIQEHKLYLTDIYNIPVDFDSINSRYTFENQVENRLIYFDFKKNKQNEALELIDKELKDKNKSLEFIFFHECGHVIQHTSLLLNNKDKDFCPVMYYDKNTGQELISLNNFLGNMKKPENMAEFIHSNLHEAYADMYACYALYLKNNTITHINEVINFRTNVLNDIKSKDKEFVTPNENIEALKIFEQELSKQPSFVGKSYKEIHQIFQGIALKGLLKTIIEECKTNEAFLNDFTSFNNGNIASFFDKVYDEAQSYNILSSSELVDIKKEIANLNPVMDTSKHINKPKVREQFFINWEVLYKNRKEQKLETKKIIAIK